MLGTAVPDLQRVALIGAILGDNTQLISYESRFHMGSRPCGVYSSIDERNSLDRNGSEKPRRDGAESYHASLSSQWDRSLR